mmetsp:Transcript_25542/g.40028  ORF Transcript_25542/g.40028 Transcript_25542/m.40028 type:complete len:352 (-) Transcript_25542:116-1171(-)
MKRHSREAGRLASGLGFKLATFETERLLACTSARLRWWAEAKGCWETAERSASKSKDSWQYTQCCVGVAEACCGLGSFGEGAEWLDKASTSCSSDPKPRSRSLGVLMALAQMEDLRSKALVHSGTLALRAKQYRKATEVFQGATEAAARGLAALAKIEPLTTQGLKGEAGNPGTLLRRSNSTKAGGRGASAVAGSQGAEGLRDRGSSFQGAREPGGQGARDPGLGLGEPRLAQILAKTKRSLEKRHCGANTGLAHSRMEDEDVDAAIAAWLQMLRCTERIENQVERVEGQSYGYDHLSRAWEVKGDQAKALDCRTKAEELDGLLSRLGVEGVEGSDTPSGAKTKSSACAIL